MRRGRISGQSLEERSGRSSLVELRRRATVVLQQAADAFVDNDRAGACRGVAPEDPVLLAEVVDGLELLPILPSGERREEGLERNVSGFMRSLWRKSTAT